jgi:proteasome accessory factor BC
VVEELKDGAVIVELQYAGNDWLAREILKEAGDAAVLEPEDARNSVLEAAEALAGAVR